MRTGETEPDSGTVQAGRLAPWLPMLLVVGGFSLDWLPSQNALLSAVWVGAYLAYVSAVTWLHILPWLSARLS